MTLPTYYRRERVPGAINGVTLLPVVVIDGTSSKVETTDVTSLSFSHTVTSGNVLYVLLGSNTLSNPSTTYNGVSMERISLTNAGGNIGSVAVFRLINPDVGNNTVSITGIALGYAMAYSISLRVQDTSAPNTDVSTINGTSTSASISASSRDTSVVLDMITGFGATADEVIITVGENQTQVVSSGSPGYRYTGGSYEFGKSSVNMAWILSRAGSGWHMVALSVGTQ